jgi:hypothetical protein
MRRSSVLSISLQLVPWLNFFYHSLLVKVNLRERLKRARFAVPSYFKYEVLHWADISKIAGHWVTLNREAFLKGKAQYGWAPYTNYSDKLLLILKILFTFFTKQASYLNEEVNCTEPFPSVSIPCLKYMDNEQ